MNYDVFISYSRRDSKIAEEICSALTDAGLTFFIDAEARVEGKLCAKGSLIFMLADKPE